MPRNIRKTRVSLRAVRAAARTVARGSRFGDHPIHLQIEPTSHCNYDCLMCVHKEAISKPTHIDVARFEKLIQQVKPFFVTFNGYGEPLLHPQLFDMVRLLKKRGCSVNTTTNGFLLDRYIGEAIASGIDQINISLDAATEAAYQAIRRNTHFNKILENIRALVRERKKHGNRPLVCGTFVIQPRNQREMEPFIHLARELGMDMVLFQPYLNPTEAGAEGIGAMDTQTLRAALQNAAATAQRLGVRTNLNQLLRKIVHFLDVQYRLKPRPDIMKRCVKPWFSAYLTAEGNVRPCCSFAAIPLNMGNAFEGDMLKILNSEEMARFRNALRRGAPPHWLCARCVPDSLADLLGRSSW